VRNSLLPSRHQRKVVFISAVCKYHLYWDECDIDWRKTFCWTRDFVIPWAKFGVLVLKVMQRYCETLALHVLLICLHVRRISVQFTNCRQHCKQLYRGIEIPYQVECYSFSNKGCKSQSLETIIIIINNGQTFYSKPKHSFTPKRDGLIENKNDKLQPWF